ncbi:MAG: hypothetical protein U0587_04205 [Candidatus Binatia bacterium]
MIGLSGMFQACGATTIGEPLLCMIRDQFALEWDGIHGAPHWARVCENGLRLARSTGAKRHVIELFSVLHDARRLDDGDDFEHGQRAARFVQQLAGVAFELPPDDLELLIAACRRHSDGLMAGDITVLTCWDADRLDLGRVGIKPTAERLCTTAARDPAVMSWAYHRSLR